MKDIIVVERCNNKEVGFIKAYPTMEVEDGFFPTELSKKDANDAKELLKVERTGVRVGWLDLVMVKEEIEKMGITTFGISHLEVLGKLRFKWIADRYLSDHRVTRSTPKNWEKTVPIYKQFIGTWNLQNCKKWEDIPSRVKYYIEYIEKNLGIQIEYVKIEGENPRVIRRHYAK